MNKHTPGPWRIADHLAKASVICIYSGKDQLICELRDPEDDTDIVRMRYNAPVLAAAPTLLAACQAVIAHRSKDYLDNTIEPYAELVRAIAEAEGTSTS